MFPVSTGIKLYVLVYERNMFALKHRGPYWQAVVMGTKCIQKLNTFC
jgi:hypothetical protein